MWFPPELMSIILHFRTRAMLQDYFRTRVLQELLQRPKVSWDCESVCRLLRAIPIGVSNHHDCYLTQLRLYWSLPSSLYVVDVTSGEWWIKYEAMLGSKVKLNQCHYEEINQETEMSGTCTALFRPHIDNPRIFSHVRHVVKECYYDPECAICKMYVYK
jgi:hypothetical protein